MVFKKIPDDVDFMRGGTGRRNISRGIMRSPT